MQKPEKSGEFNLEVVVKDGVVCTEIADEMSYVHNVGPGDPLLAKQKHHHRKAFEYISKALKIDEENEGKLCIMFLRVCVHDAFENITNLYICKKNFNWLINQCLYIYIVHIK